MSSRVLCPRMPCAPLIVLKFIVVRFEHFKLEGYDPHGAIKMEMAV